MKLHPGGAVVPEDEEFDATERGILDFGINSPGLWRDKFPAAGLFSTMIGGPSASELTFWYVAGGGLELINRMVEGHNVHMIYATYSTGEVFLYSTVPLNTVADLDGVKTRLFGDEAEILSILGMIPVAVSSPEVYESVQRGVIDAFQHASLANDWPLGFHEIVDYAYISGVRQASAPEVMEINNNSWAELPDDLKILVQDMLLGSALRHYAEATYEETQSAAKYIDAGVNVVPAPKEIVDAVLEEAEKFYAMRSAEDPFYGEVVQSLMDFKKAYETTFTRF
jgi:TRAP-type mannitol/chloroaromatic compound transport system substrate-binding protein